MKMNKPTYSYCLVFLLFSSFSFHVSAQSFVITKTRAPKIDVSGYKQIAIGDITGPSGTQTQESLNLSDELSSKLFNSNAQEILDRNALDKMLTSGTTLIAGDEKIVAALKKKLNSAVMLTGRIQTKNISQEEISSKNIVVVNGCSYSYNWKAMCEIVVQVKLVDISTGKMLYNSPVVKKSLFESKASCEHTQKFDPSYIASETLKEVAAEITRLLVPYIEEINVAFQTGSLLKNPFKKNNEAVILLKNGGYQEALQILKGYTEDKSLKEKFKAQAYFNYGMGLFCSNQYEDSKAEIKKALSANSSDFTYQYWLGKIVEEQLSEQKIAVNNTSPRGVKKAF